MNILIICKLNYVGAMPFLIGTVIGLTKRGHNVFIDLPVGTDFFGSDELTGLNVKFYAENKNKLLNHLQYLKKNIFPSTNGKKLDLIITVGQIGLLFTGFISLFRSTPFVHFNDELHGPHNVTERRRKLFETLFLYFIRFSNQRAKITITQDVNRGRLLSKLNRIPLDKIRYLPNSTFGKAKKRNTNTFHQIFNLKNNSTNILWMGTSIKIFDSGIYELICESKNFKSDFNFIIHLRSNQSPNNLKKLEEVIEDNKYSNIFISKQIVPFKDLDILVSSASIGIVLYYLYEEKGINVNHIGASSGQLNLYLKNGIPCIVQKLPGLLWVEEEKAGICVTSIDEIKRASMKIINNYDFYSRNAIFAYNKYGLFDDKFEIIVKEIELI
jgi:hypothetical protein